MFTGSGWTQQFANGRILSGPSGTFAVTSPVLATYDTLGGLNGRLGWPTSGATSLPGGVRQDFAGGSIFVETDGAQSGAAVVGAIRNVYLANGGPSTVGYPTAAEMLTPWGWKQTFSSGAVFVPHSYPSSVVAGSIYALFLPSGAESVFGVPTGSARTSGEGTVQPFERATIYSSSAGTWYARGSIGAIYDQRGAQTGVLGWPLESEQTVAGGWKQAFSGGAIYVSGFGAFVTKGSLGTEYLRRGGQSGALGWPTGNEALVSGLWTQPFQNGTLTLLADGTFAVR